ncbi:MAG: DUF4199 domain-containing protein [Saprospirales bacterium]|nr:MAG: DUF4199 domain-containing protein [Saprospirales bacterium]
MSNRHNLKYKHEFRWAVVLTAFSGLWLFLAYLLGFLDKRIDLYLSLQSLWLIPASLIFYWAIKNLRDGQNKGELSFWQGVQSGTLIAVIAIPMHILLNLLFFYTLGAGFFEAAIQYSIELGMDPRELEVFYSFPALLFRETTGLIAFGFIISLFLSMFLKRES